MPHTKSSPAARAATKKQVTEPNASLAPVPPAMPNRLTDAVIPAPTVGLWVPKTPTAVVNVPKTLAPVMQISLPQTHVAAVAMKVGITPLATMAMNYAELATKNLALPAVL